MPAADLSRVSLGHGVLVELVLSQSRADSLQVGNVLGQLIDGLDLKKQ